MSSMEPMLKWGIPFVIILTAWACFAPWLKKSDKLRWLYAFLSSLVISPVLDIGCPGMSIEPLWVVLTTWRLGNLFFMLELAAFFVLMPLTITTGAIYAVVRLGCRMSLESKS